MVLPPVGQYATGNLFLNPDDLVLKESKEMFEEIARDLGMY